MLLIARYIAARERSERTHAIIDELIEKQRERSERTVPFVAPLMLDELPYNTDRDTGPDPGSRTTERIPRSNTRLEDVYPQDRPTILPEHLRVRRATEPIFTPVFGNGLYYINTFTGELTHGRDGLTIGSVRALSEEPRDIPREVIVRGFPATRYEPGNVRGQMQDYAYILDEGEDEDESYTSTD